MPFFNSNLKPHDDTFRLKSISVDERALLAFEKGTSAQSQDDLLSFILFCILVVKRKKSPFENPEDWFGELQSTMSRIGFFTTGSEWYTGQLSSDITLSQVALDTIHSDTRDAVKQAFEAIGKSDNEEALRVLNSAAGDHKKAALLTGLTSRNGNASTLTLYGFFGKVSKPNDNVLESGFKQGDEFSYGQIEAILTDTMAKKVRKIMKERLAPYFDEYVKPVKL
ncbi:hypothetical protein RSOLAG22IIIB_13147 [Rhizoctonia solani]|uniref:Uncharacterized protein n=1 Tax=Rhizoctonia solani TaxID=456999 RepID=A0A0K6GJ06_9AGAM|nr:hypothetical protein RSOLAG22IIIB_13147 [Rhizoctonia solani]